MTSRKRILIASSTFDEHTHGPVRDRLTRAGYEVIVYLTDRVLAGTETFELELRPSGELRMVYDGQSIAPPDISAAWYWKVSGFRLNDAQDNVSKQLSLVNEIAQWNSAIWGLYPEAVWLNSPKMSADADRKLEQLIAAQRAGFETPHTVVGNTWPAIEEALAGETMIVKMLRGVLADQNNVKAMYTSPLSKPVLAGLRTSTVPFPGLYQPFIEKAREWRVTVVGNRSFAVAIYTEPEAKDDWRRLQLTPAVRFVEERLPDEVLQRCCAYLEHSGLRYGAFDLVETPDGQIVFLECNPNGQHNWLEELLGLPIAEAIAAELAAIADGAPSGNLQMTTFPP